MAALCQFTLGIEVVDAAFPVMCASIPFWLAGFWRPFGMRAEEFVPLLADHHLNDQRLIYSSRKDPHLPGVAKGKPSRRSRRATKKKGAEAYEPTKQQPQ